MKKRIRAWLMRLLEPELKELLKAEQAYGYTIGLAHGELQGRQQLADEIQAMHGVDGGNKEMGFEQAKRIKARQLH